MIINKSIIRDTYRCNALVAKHLVYSGVPVLSYDDNYFYFRNTDRLNEALKNMPLYLKLLSKLYK